MFTTITLFQDFPPTKVSFLVAVRNCFKTYVERDVSVITEALGQLSIPNYGRSLKLFPKISQYV